MTAPNTTVAAVRQAASGYALRALPHNKGLTPLPGTSTSIGPAGLPRTALLTRLTCQQLQLVLTHCAALRGRLERGGKSIPGSLMRRLAAIERGDDVGLFFHINDITHDPVEVGTSLMQAEVPAGLRLGGDAGRHYFLTHCYQRGLSDSLIDIAARHAMAGVESMSSTSRVSLWSARRRIDAIVTAEMAQLGIAPLAGLSRR